MVRQDDSPDLIESIMAECIAVLFEIARGPDETPTAHGENWAYGMRDHFMRYSTVEVCSRTETAGRVANARSVEVREMSFGKRSAVPDVLTVFYPSSVELLRHSAAPRPQKRFIHDAQSQARFLQGCVRCEPKRRTNCPRYRRRGEA
jgi:hypothetical protein